MTRSEALLLLAAHTALGIADDHYYLFDDDGTVKQMRMSNGTVSTPSSSAAYIRPVANVTINNESYGSAFGLKISQHLKVNQVPLAGQK